MLPEKYLHFSTDDVCLWLKELTEGNYPSIFEHPAFGRFYSLHEKYGAVFTMNLFYEAPNGSFTLDKMTERYRAEWEAHAHWLRFSFHGLTNKTNYHQTPAKDALMHYEAVYRQIARFASPKCFDTVVRTHFFSGTAETLRLWQKCSPGIRGILTSDDNRVANYHLCEKKRDDLYHHGYLRDEALGLFCVKSFQRLDNPEHPVALLEQLQKTGLEDTSKGLCARDSLRYLEIFWHEGTPGIEKLEEICIWAKKQKYAHGFLMDRICTFV